MHALGFITSDFNIKPAGEPGSYTFTIEGINLLCYNKPPIKPLARFVLGKN